MSGDNGKDLGQNQEAPTVIEMRIVAEVGKPMTVHFPVLMDKVVTYGFLKMAEKTLDAHYAQVEKKVIVQHKNGIMDFVRRKN